MSAIGRQLWTRRATVALGEHCWSECQNIIEIEDTLVEYMWNSVYTYVDSPHWYYHWYHVRICSIYTCITQLQKPCAICVYDRHTIGTCCDVQCMRCSLLTKKKPLKVTFGMGIEEHDQEGRLIVAEYDTFYVMGCCE